MPRGQREKSLHSSPAHRSALTLVASEMRSREMPRWIRIRRRLGPKASRSLILAPSLSQERVQSADEPGGRILAVRARPRSSFLHGTYSSRSEEHTSELQS